MGKSTSILYHQPNNKTPSGFPIPYNQEAAMNSILYVLHEGRRIDAHNDTIEATFVKVSTNLGQKLVSKYPSPVYHSLTVSESEANFVPEITRIIFPVENNKDLAGKLKAKAKKQFNVTKQATILVILASMILVSLTADSLNLLHEYESYQISFALAAIAVANLIVNFFSIKKSGGL